MGANLLYYKVYRCRRCFHRRRMVVFCIITIVLIKTVAAVLYMM